MDISTGPYRRPGAKAVARGVLLVVLVMAAAVPGTLPAPAAGQGGGLRGSILIVGDAEFTPENGVVAGSGTPDDPYTIAGWTIARTNAVGVHLMGTSAHVVIEDIVLLQAPFQGSFWCLGSGCGASGIRLENAENVVVRDVRFAQEQSAVFVLGSSHVVLEDLVLRADRTTNLALQIGIGVFDSTDVVLRRLDVSDSLRSLQVSDSSHVRLEDSLFTPPRPDNYGGNIDFYDSREVQLIGNRFVDVDARIHGGERVAVVGNQVRGPDGQIAVRGRFGEPIVRVLVCQNDFHAPGYSSVLTVGLASGVAVVGNRFVDNFIGAYVFDTTAFRFERNALEGSQYYGALIAASGAQVQNNSFEGNEIGLSLAAPADARYNWWGEPSGPSGAGPGAGDALEAETGVEFEPWLTAAPGLGVDCEPESVPAPLPPPLFERLAFSGASAAVAHFGDVPEDHLVDYAATFSVLGPDVGFFFAAYDPADPANGTRWGWRSGFGDVGTHTGIAGLSVDAAALDVHWTISVGFFCRGSACPGAILVAAAGTEPFGGYSFQMSDGDDLLEFRTTERVGFITETTMDEDGVRAKASAFVGRAAVNVGSQETVNVETSLFGFSRYEDQPPQAALREFDVSRPNGAVEDASALIFMADEPGDYRFRLNQIDAGTFDGPAVMWVDAAP